MMNEFQKIFAKRIIPLNIEQIKNNIPELQEKISELEKAFDSLASDSKRVKE